MIRRIDVATIQVRDQDRALEFYRDSLGFEVVSDERFGEGMRWIQVKPPGAETSLTLAHGFAEGTPGGFTGIVFGTDDIEGTHRDLSAKGVRFTEPPTKQEWGMVQAILSDPDGNEFVLVGPPG